MGARRGPTIVQILVIAGFSLSCFGLLLFLWLSFGGATPLKPQGYTFKAAFPEAAQLADQADVRVSGVPIGKVINQETDPKGNRSLATIEVKEKYAPIRSDAKAILRQKTLLGETYVELTLGSRGARAIPEGGRLSDARIENPVEFDELIRIFDSDTREAFKLWQSELARSSARRGVPLNEAFGHLPGFAENAGDTLEILDRRRNELRGLVRDTGTVFEALTRSTSDLQAFITRTSEVFQATGSQREALAQSIAIFPTFLDESRATLARLERSTVNAEPLLRDLEPVLENAQPTVRDIGRLSPDLRRLFNNLDPLIAASRKGLPALGSVLDGLRPTLAELGPFLRELNPILQWLELNMAQVSDFINVGPSALAGVRATISGETNGHVLPQIITTGSQSLVTPTRSPDNRGNSYLQGGQLMSQSLKEDLTLPSWDCNHVGGPRPANTAPSPFGQPACTIDPPIPFQGRTTKFPQVRQAPNP